MIQNIIFRETNNTHFIDEFVVEVRFAGDILFLLHFVHLGPIKARGPEPFGGYLTPYLLVTLMFSLEISWSY